MTLVPILLISNLVAYILAMFTSTTVTDVYSFLGYNLVIVILVGFINLASIVKTLLDKGEKNDK